MGRKRQPVTAVTIAQHHKKIISTKKHKIRPLLKRFKGGFQFNDNSLPPIEAKNPQCCWQCNTCR